MSRSEDAVAVTDAWLRTWPLPVPPPGSKDLRGAIVVVAGSPPMPGAAILTGEAALRGGAGKLQIVTCDAVAVAVGAAVREALVVGVPATGSGAIALDAADTIVARANAADALVIGPGLVDEIASAALLARVLPRLTTPAVVDAAALACVATPNIFAALAGAVAVTPHAGEMASMLAVSRDAVEADPAHYARLAAEKFGAVAALKGATTFIATPDGRLFRNDDGHVGLATSGSGDVLAGIVGALVARGAPVEQAVVWGVALHARAGGVLGERIGVGFLAREIAAEIPAIARDLARTPV